MTLTERAAYLQGLAEGLKLDETKAEGKLISELLGLVGDMAAELRDLREYVEELDGDLGQVEEDLYDVDDEEYDEVCDLECDCGSFVEISTDNIKDGKIVCPDCGKEYTLEEVCGDCDGCCGC